MVGISEESGQGSSVISELLQSALDYYLINCGMKNYTSEFLFFYLIIL